MATHYARNAYLQAKVQPETDPKRLILMLYEGALEDLRLAKEAIEQHNARQRGEHLSRAVAIVSTLLTSLDSQVTDEPIAFLRGLYQAILVALSKVAVTHEVTALDLAFRYLEHLKQIWEQNVMGLQAQTSAVWQQETPPVARSAGAPPVVAQHSAYGRPAPLGARRTVSV
jgi:flagellar protein FliS